MISKTFKSVLAAAAVAVPVAAVATTDAFAIGPHFGGGGGRPSVGPHFGGGGGGRPAVGPHFGGGGMRPSVGPHFGGGQGGGGHVGGGRPSIDPHFGGGRPAVGPHFGGGGHGGAGPHFGGARFGDHGGYRPYGYGPRRVVYGGGGCGYGARYSADWDRCVPFRPYD